MKFHLLCLVALLGLITIGRAADNNPGTAVAPLYVQIDADDPGMLDRLQRTGDKTEFVNDSLRESASTLASDAHWSSEIRVLHQGETPPAGAAVLRFIFPGPRVEFLSAAQGRAIFLGRVGNLPVDTHHPDPNAMRHRVDPAPIADKPIIREQIVLEKDLYVALQYLEKRLGQNYIAATGASPTSAARPSGQR